MKISMCDMAAQYQSLKDEINESVNNVLQSGHFILGPNVKSFEKEASDYLGVKHAISVASGTDALHLAVRAAGIGEGDEVITTAFTFIGTAEAISYTGARPVFVDIDPLTYNLDIKQIEAAITPNTKAIMPVHLFGQAADLKEIKFLCEKNNLFLIEDCAQSFGSEYANKKTGSHGDFGCFSFYPSKNLGAYGDGGLIVTDSDEFAETIIGLRNHGSMQPYMHNMIGYNSRLDEIQAAILRVKLKYIDSFNLQRQRVADRYKQQLKDTEVVIPYVADQRTHVYHQYTIRSEKRDEIKDRLTAAEIASAIYYPIPLHRQPVYKTQYNQQSLPDTDQASLQVLSLPVYPELSDQNIDIICSYLTD